MRSNVRFAGHAAKPTHCDGDGRHDANFTTGPRRQPGMRFGKALRKLKRAIEKPSLQR